jgi:hypothetical protein
MDELKRNVRKTAAQLAPRSNENWEFNLNAIRAREQDALNEAYMRAQEEKNDALMYPWLARIIVQWPFASDPAQVASYGDLGLEDHMEVFVRFGVCFRDMPARIAANAGFGPVGGEGRSAGRAETSDDG